MPLYGQFARHAQMKISFPGLIFAKYKSIILILQSEDQRNDETWTWLKEGKLKRETESLIVAAQDQATRTNYVKATIDRTHRPILKNVQTKQRDHQPYCMCVPKTGTKGIYQRGMTT